MAGKVNLHEQFGRFDDYWSPKIVASVNDYDVEVVLRRLTGRPTVTRSGRSTTAWES